VEMYSLFTYLHSLGVSTLFKLSFNTLH